MNDPVFGEAYTTYQLERSGLRRWIRRQTYFRNMLRFVQGPTLDFGCGVGEFLALLPAGSVGYEINEATVRYCRSRGLTVQLYDPDRDAYQLSDRQPGQFQTLVVAHVLEHLPDAHTVIRQLLATADRLRLRRVLFVVPGEKGYQHDKTHRTFIDPAYFRQHGLEQVGPYRIVHQRYFPVPAQWFSRFFTHNELVTVYERMP